MGMITERRTDDALRAVMDQAIYFKQTLGRSVAVAFLVEHNIPPPLLQRVLMETPLPADNSPA